MLVEIPIYAHRALWALIFAGVFERHPRPEVRADRAGHELGARHAAEPRLVRQAHAHRDRRGVTLRRRGGRQAQPHAERVLPAQLLHRGQLHPARRVRAPPRRRRRPHHVGQRLPAHRRLVPLQPRSAARVVRRRAGSRGPHACSATPRRSVYGFDLDALDPDRRRASARRSPRSRNRSTPSRPTRPATRSTPTPSSAPGERPASAPAPEALVVDRRDRVELGERAGELGHGASGARPSAPSAAPAPARAPASLDCRLGHRGRRRHLHPGGRHWRRWRRGDRRRGNRGGFGFGAPCRDRVRVDGSRRVEPPQLLLGFTDAQLLLRQGALEFADLVQRVIAPLQRRREAALEFLDLLRERIARGVASASASSSSRRRRWRRFDLARRVRPASTREVRHLLHRVSRARLPRCRAGARARGPCRSTRSWRWPPRTSSVSFATSCASVSRSRVDVASSIRSFVTSWSRSFGAARSSSSCCCEQRRAPRRAGGRGRSRRRARPPRLRARPRAAPSTAERSEALPGCAPAPRRAPRSARPRAPWRCRCAPARR